MTGSTPLRIVGMGSPNGDDAAGWAVVRCLPEGLAGAECHCLHGGQQLLDLLDGRGSLLLIDAVVSGAPPGTIHRLEWPDPRLEALHPGSTHGLRPAEALHLAATLKVLPPHVVVFGIEAAQVATGSELSPPVAAAAAQLAQHLEETYHARALAAARPDESD